MKANHTHNSKCSHDGATKVISVKKTKLWAGSRDDLLRRSGWKLVISAVGYTDFTKSPLSGTKAAHALLPEAVFAWEPPPCLGIDWPDRGIPTLNRAWWIEVAEALRAINGNVGLCCFGGHGRTGTMLAILAGLLGRVKKGACPVAWVRAAYCKAAVESDAQLDYIEYVTGLKVPSEPSDTPHTALSAPNYGSLPASPTPASSYPKQIHPSATGTGLKPGADEVDEVDASDAALMGGDPTDDELLALWFKSEGDTIEVTTASGAKRRLGPVWDNCGELAGWREE